MIEWIKKLFVKQDTPAPKQLYTPSKKDAGLAMAMWEADEYYEEREALLGEAYDFHMDCGDR